MNFRSDPKISPKVIVSTDETDRQTYENPDQDRNQNFTSQFNINIFKLNMRKFILYISDLPAEFGSDLKFFCQD